MKVGCGGGGRDEGGGGFGTCEDAKYVPKWASGRQKKRATAIP